MSEQWMIARGWFLGQDVEGSPGKPATLQCVQQRIKID
jgi:hypothetical protein